MSAQFHMPAFMFTLNSISHTIRPELKELQSKESKTSLFMKPAPFSHKNGCVRMSSAQENSFYDEFRRFSKNFRQYSEDLPALRSNSTPQEVISVTLNALKANDVPVKDTGTSLLLRFASDRFKLQMRWMIGTAQSAAVLSSSLRKSNSQYNLLFCPYDFSFPSDTYHIDKGRAFQEVQLESCQDLSTLRPGGVSLLAKLGWELIRDEQGCWRTDMISWHDFRDEYRPGEGQEEWPRICG